MSRRVPRSTWVPILLLIYLAVMAVIGYPEFQKGNYLYYFGIIALTLFIIAILRQFLLRQEKKRNGK